MERVANRIDSASRSHYAAFRVRFSWIIGAAFAGAVGSKGSTAVFLELVPMNSIKLGSVCLTAMKVAALREALVGSSFRRLDNSSAMSLRSTPSPVPRLLSQRQKRCERLLSLTTFSDKLA
jgi:hypothetical protein